MILLDTHIFIWLVNNDENLPVNYQKLLETEQEKYISVITCWEILLLLKKDRLKLKSHFNEWISKSLNAFNIQVINLDLEIVLAYDSISNFHKDPADNLIAATSISK